MKKSTFKITKMDCPSEENMIRLKLSEFTDVRHLDFDIDNRILQVYHDDNLDSIDDALKELNLGSTLSDSVISTDYNFDEESDQSKLLWTVLLINLAFFFIEMTTGLVSKSMGLVADSLDMLADAFVYGISLFAVGGSISRKKSIANTAGWFQIILAIAGFAEVIRRFISGEVLPDFSIMIVVSILALFANGFCLYLLHKSKSKKEAHMQASLIFTSNDVIINLGVIVAGVLVYVTSSRFPDLIVGSIVFVMVLQGAIRILKLGR